MSEIDIYYLAAREDMSWVVRNLLENLIGESVTLTERTLIVANSYNDITGTVTDLDGDKVLLSDCSGINQWGEWIEGDHWYHICSIRLYHPSLLAFFKLHVHDQA